MQSSGPALARDGMAFGRHGVGCCFNVGQSPDGGCRRYDAACAAARDVFGTMVGGIQDRQRRKRVEGCGVGMRRREWIAC